jgi:hypothetical protein
MPDDTPLEVLTLCDGKVQAWVTRVMRLPSATPPIKTLGELRQASDIQLLAVDGVGKKLVVELRRFCPVCPSALPYSAQEFEARCLAARALRQPCGSFSGPRHGQKAAWIRNGSLTARQSSWYTLALAGDDLPAQAVNC